MFEHPFLCLRPIFIGVAFFLSWPLQASTAASVEWQPFSPAAFEQARKENKQVLLDLVAVWCHWCHVMDAKTYADPEVAAYIHTHYVPVKADHDARPDLAERYRDWGWPATVILNPQGRDIVKRAGYMDRDDMLRMLRAVVLDPSPEADRRAVMPKQIPDRPVLGAALRAQLQQRHVDTYDEKEGGLTAMMKYLDRDAVLWSLRQIEAGDTEEKRRLQKTLDASLALIDPAFGGVYQYSTHGEWTYPHYEKIMLSQWVSLISYSRSCMALKEDRYCQAGRQVAAYLQDFLQASDGGFYTSQDADLVQGQKAHDYFAQNRQARLKRGLPRIDKNQYSSVNGMAIEGLAELYIATKDEQYLVAALAATKWAINNRRLWGGGFRHAWVDDAGPYLADTLYMGRAFLALYRATGERGWLERSLKAAAFIDKELRHPQAGLAAAADDGTPLKPLPQIDQNIQAAHWLLDLARLSEEPQPRALASWVMRYLAAPEVALSRITEAGLLEADWRWRSEQPGVKAMADK